MRPTATGDAFRDEAYGLDDPWSSLWQTGARHSCLRAFQDSYGGEILEFWRRQFKELSSGERVVDIATGNGALTLIAQGVAREQSTIVEIHGIDNADIDPPTTVPGGEGLFSGIRFHPRTPAQALPFPSGTVDFVCSQFGFEYAPMDSALEELLRVLAPDCHVGMILHSDDSVIERTSRSQLNAAQYLLRDGPVLGDARVLLSLLAAPDRPPNRQTLAGDKEAHAVRSRFNSSAQALLQRLDEPGAPELLKRTTLQLRSVLELMRTDAKGALQALDALIVSIRHEEHRLQDLLSSCVSEKELGRFCSRLRTAGFCVEAGSIFQGASKMGWTLVASRASP